MKYNYRTGLEQKKSNTRKFLAGISAGAIMVVAGAVPALAAGNAPGYTDNPGRQQAVEVGAQCESGAASGAFGAFGGKDNNLAGGANGDATGRYNSAVCGNRQGNL